MNLPELGREPFRFCERLLTSVSEPATALLTALGMSEASDAIAWSYDL